MNRIAPAMVAALAAAVASPAWSQARPPKPVRVVVNFPPGGAADRLMRALSPRLQETLGQPFVVENRPGANGSIGAGEIAKAAPDGHSILMSSGGAIALNGLIYATLGYDPMKSLDPVAPVAVVSVFLEIQPSIPAANLSEFIAHARANPGKLRMLAVGSPKRHPAWPDVRKVAEAVGRELDTDTVFGLYAPAGTPTDVIARLNQEVTRQMQGGPMAERVAAIGATGLQLTPEAFVAGVRAEHARMSGLVEEIGLKAN